MVKTDKPMSMGSRIIAASDKGLAPADIAELLGTNIKYVYTTRCTERNRRGGKGTEHWFQQEVGVAKPKAPPAAKPKPTEFEKEAIKINKYFDEVRRLNADPAINAYQPKITFIEEPKASFFSRVKAAYAVLRGA
jgi:hypothetical protein